MSDPITPVDNTNPLFHSAPTSTNATTAGGVAQSHSAAGGGLTKINSLEDLKKKAPQVYKMMMLSLQESVRRDMQNHQEHLKKIMREGRQD